MHKLIKGKTLLESYSCTLTLNSEGILLFSICIQNNVQLEVYKIRNIHILKLQSKKYDE